MPIYSRNVGEEFALCFQIGKTMVFLKQDGAKMLTQKQREALAAWSPLVCVMEACCLKERIKRELAKKARFLVRTQAHIRR